MEKLLESSAFMGLLGVIIGSCLSTFGVLYSEHKKSKATEKQIEREQIAEKERVCKNFLNFIKDYEMLFCSFILQAPNLIAEEDKRNFLKSMGPVLVEIDLKTSPELSSACHKLFNCVVSFDRQKYNESYAEVVNLMKLEIGNSANGKNK